MQTGYLIKLQIKEGENYIELGYYKAGYINQDTIKDLII